MQKNITLYYKLEHSGIKGMKWGIRRYQNDDGTLTEEGRKRYMISSDSDEKKLAKYASKYNSAVDKYTKRVDKAYNYYNRKDRHNLADVINLAKYDSRMDRYKNKIAKKFGELSAKDICNSSLKNHGYKSDMVENLLSSKPFMYSTVATNDSLKTEYIWGSNFEKTSKTVKKR